MNLIGQEKSLGDQQVVDLSNFRGSYASLGRPHTLLYSRGIKRVFIHVIYTIKSITLMDFSRCHYAGEFLLIISLLYA